MPESTSAWELFSHETICCCERRVCSWAKPEILNFVGQSGFYPKKLGPSLHSSEEFRPSLSQISNGYA
jgi:hypothetical protein